MTSHEILRQAAEHWSKVTNSPPKGQRRWWQCPTIWRHINERLCGQPLTQPHAGFHLWMVATSRIARFEKGLSIGCGSGVKEISLVSAGVVQAFDLYEISDARIRMGTDEVRKRRLEGRITFHQGNAFDEAVGSGYDLVYWNNALHHMLDVDFAIRWSRDRLLPGGLFAMDDFVGRSRFQWTDTNLEFASRFRAALPPEYLCHPDNPGKKLSPKLHRPSIQAMIETDPTEAADSERILPCLKSTFPHANIMLTGGCIYHLALNDVLANITHAEDAPYLHMALLLDDALSAMGETHYAVASAVK